MAQTLQKWSLIFFLLTTTLSAICQNVFTRLYQKIFYDTLNKEVVILKNFSMTNWLDFHDLDI